MTVHHSARGDSLGSSRPCFGRHHPGVMLRGEMCPGYEIEKNRKEQERTGKIIKHKRKEWKGGLRSNAEHWIRRRPRSRWRTASLPPRQGPNCLARAALVWLDPATGRCGPLHHARELSPQSALCPICTLCPLATCVPATYNEQCPAGRSHRQHAHQRFTFCFDHRSGLPMMGWDMHRGLADCSRARAASL